MKIQTSIATILEFPRTRDPSGARHIRQCTVDDIEFHSLKPIRHVCNVIPKLLTPAIRCYRPSAAARSLRERFSDVERATLGEIDFRLGRSALSEVRRPPSLTPSWRVVRGGSLLGKFDGSPARRVTGRPRIDRDVEQLIIRMAREKSLLGV